MISNDGAYLSQEYVNYVNNLLLILLFSHEDDHI